MIDTELVADGEHIADDLSATIKLIGEEMSEKMFDAMVEFVQSYIVVSVETALESPQWFKQ